MTADTKTRILDTAERLFAERGYASTSLRNITTAAGVNLAAIHYHFHSKDALLESVVSRRSDVVNKRRLDMLEHFRQEAAGGPVPLEKLFQAFLAPAFDLVRTSGEVGLRFTRLIGRLHAEGDMPHQIMARKFGPVVQVFHAALQEALPGIPAQELWWRIHFAVGSMAHALRWSQQIELIPGAPMMAPDNELTLSRLISFISAGFRVPSQTVAELNQCLNQAVSQQTVNPQTANQQVVNQQGVNPFVNQVVNS
jgi:AcrR family transcriptional regulator